MKQAPCSYDYANKCDCAEDDKCGCTYPNNLSHDFDCPTDPTRTPQESAEKAETASLRRNKKQS